MMNSLNVMNQDCKENTCTFNHFFLVKDIGNRRGWRGRKCYGMSKTFCIPCVNNMYSQKINFNESSKKLELQSLGFSSFPPLPALNFVSRRF